MAHAKGLRDRRVMTMYAGRNAILPPLTGFAAQFGERGRRARLHRVRLQLPRRRPDAAAGGARLRLPARAGAAARRLSVCVLVANLIMDLALRRPRPARARELADVAARPDRVSRLARRAAASAGPAPRRRLAAAPALTNPKSCFGIVVLVGIVLVSRCIAPLISRRTRRRDRRAPGPVADHGTTWFGTTDQGYDVFSQVVWAPGARSLLGFAGGVLATVIAATLGITRRLRRRAGSTTSSTS